MFGDAETTHAVCAREVTTMLSFPPFRLDLESERLWKGDESLHLRRKPFAILRYLVQNPNRLVSHEEIVGAVWGKVAMSESLLRTHVRDLRQTIGEGIVETVAGRGYRFAADVGYVPLETVYDGREEASRRIVVGRDAELTTLRAALRGVNEQRRTTVFVTGEAGVGKTTLVDHFVEQTSARTPILVGRGACVEHEGEGQAYLPLLEAVGALCRGRHGDRVTDELARLAPTWLSQMPGVVANDRLEELQRRAAGATQAQMLRELAEALEALGALAPVVFVLEDMHWTDASTVEALALIARRRGAARCLVLATYRPAEVVRGGPLSRVVGELVSHRQASAMELEGFDAEDLDDYLGRRFPGHQFPPELASNLLQSTGGNPLFVTTLADALEAQGLISSNTGVWQLTCSMEDVVARRPDGILRLIDAQVDRLAAIEQRIIEAASVVGMTFTSGAVACALAEDPDIIDSCCESLTYDRKLLRYIGAESSPEGQVQSRYAFGHELFRHAALARTSSVNARTWRRRIDDAQEPEPGETAPERVATHAHPRPPSHPSLLDAPRYARAVCAG